MSNGFFRGRFKAVPHPNPEYAKLGAYCIIPTDGSNLAVADCESPETARLFAAAGEMAEALEDILEYFREYESDYGTVLDCLEKGRLALAKARG